MASCRAGSRASELVAMAEGAGVGIPWVKGLVNDSTAHTALTGDVGAMVASPHKESPVLNAV